MNIIPRTAQMQVGKKCGCYQILAFTKYHSNGRAMYLVRCIRCGEIKEIKSHILYQNIKSCGCDRSHKKTKNIKKYVCDKRQNYTKINYSMITAPERIVCLDCPLAIWHNCKMFAAIRKYYTGLIAPGRKQKPKPQIRALTNVRVKKNCGRFI